MDDAKIEPLAAQMEMDDVSMLVPKLKSKAQLPSAKPKRKTKAPSLDEDENT
jgi:hypothetical protein